MTGDYVGQCSGDTDGYLLVCAMATSAFVRVCEYSAKCDGRISLVAVMRVRQSACVCVTKWCSSFNHFGSKTGKSENV